LLPALLARVFRITRLCIGLLWIGHFQLLHSRSSSSKYCALLARLIGTFFLVFGTNPLRQPGLFMAAP
jgi:hypothetical protein